MCRFTLNFLRYCRDYSSSLIGQIYFSYIAKPKCQEELSPKYGSHYKCHIFSCTFSHCCGLHVRKV
jgi:hypothetical protein